ncbi:hypothetical protein HNP38_002967 [Chryseobacterium defluvii]|uniref:DUF6759 domain-containing protein n=1 Tax=Chryseobacterium defluvii TaxID=160396 RepID=A0A840KE36_9FLAO|nr:DUF6759 domain-containing protein [Chryseobacterium defluvii]MBB4807661.1 hypothetical protein [Chryseobacterium defluvii]
MKRLLVFLGCMTLLHSCNVNYNSNYPVSRPYPAGNSSGSAYPSTAEVEREYNELRKTYKSETADVLTDLLNDSSNNPKTSVIVENASPCNMVLTISGNNYFKKVPIGAGKIGSVMVLKNQNYKLSGMVCRSVYQSTKFISGSYSVKLSN